MRFLAFVPASALASAALALSIQPRAPQAPASGAAPVSTQPAAPAPAAGPSWADFDVDGYPDLIAAGASGQAVLLRNLGDGSFADVTASYGLSQLSGLQHASWQDVDGDDLPDLLVLRGNGEVRLLRHFGAFFQDATAQAGFAQSFAALEQRWLVRELGNTGNVLSTPSYTLPWAQAAVPSGGRVLAFPGGDYPEFPVVLDQPLILDSAGGTAIFGD